MKLVSLLLLLSTSQLCLGYIDPNKIDSLCNISKQTIHDLKYKTLSRSGDFETDTLPNEIGYVVYHDSIENLKRIQIKYYSTSGEGGHDFLFSNNHIKYHSYFFYSGMNPGISMIKYLNENGELIKVHFVGRDDDSLDNRLIEEFKSIGGYDDYICGLKDGYGLFYSVSDTTTLIDAISDYQYNLKFSTQKINYILVRFIDPVVGDKTTFIDNDTPIYAKASVNSKIISKNDARTQILILDRVKDWYKVKSIYNDYVPYPFEGYVHKDDLMPVEKTIK